MSSIEPSGNWKDIPQVEELKEKIDALKAEVTRLKGVIDGAEHSGDCNIFNYQLDRKYRICICFKLERDKPKEGGGDE